MIAEPRRITKREALAIHEASLARFGGLPGLRDEGLLESALAQPFQSFGGEELYPTFAEKASRLAYGIAKNHPFLDGNKRAATASSTRTITHKPRQEDIRPLPYSPKPVLWW